MKGLMGEEVEGKGPTFSLIYATSLLQHQGQLGLNPALSVLFEI